MVGNYRRLIASLLYYVYLKCNRSIIGCAISHITLWGTVSQSNDKWHLILEDGAEFTDGTLIRLMNYQDHH